MIRRPARKNIKPEINMIPLLDVLLVLLLIFIATTPIITQNIKVNLPDVVDHKTIGNDSSSQVIVEISSVGKYSLIINHQRQTLLSFKQVVSEAQAHIIKNPQTVFLIGGAKDVPYNEIINALNLLHQAGVKSVGLMTNPV